MDNKNTQSLSPQEPQDIDPQETHDWLDALSGVLQTQGAERAHYLVNKLIEHSRRSGVNLPYKGSTDYINTISTDRQPSAPGDYDIERRIRAYVRWNAVAMVMRANQGDSNLGGHIASFASAATLYDVGFQHFWRGSSKEREGDLIYFQGHSCPGVYARAFLLGRLSEEQLDGFRQDITPQGISSYPHPWLMSDFWQFPTVSMGLGPIQAIYQARFMKYLDDRGLAKTEDRKVWAFMGDGEMDEPESMGAIGLAGRERLDNLIFVINCNLQRLDGPVRGNGKIIQELEADFRGAGWNVIKVIWGSYWDSLLAKDTKGLLRQRMMDCVDGDYQTFRSKDGAYIREHFFNTPELKAMVAQWTDDDIWRLNRGGHDPHKIYAAYDAAMKHKNQPTVILAKTIKGYGMGESGEAQNVTHQQKKMGTTSLTAFRNRFDLPIADKDLESLPYLRFEKDSPEEKYIQEHRRALGGYLPSRRQKVEPLPVPELSAFKTQLEASAPGREFSSTMAFVRILSTLLRDKNLAKRIVPIVVDESRTFGMEGLFRQIGIWNQDGQKYVPEDADQLMFYKESKTGQILQEGINEAGAVADWIAAATSYSTHSIQMLPFYVFYSMFGLQRTMDLVWAAADQRSRGFLIGGTAGRTTLNGEGLQHQDGHSHVLASAIPNCVAYDPSFAYELAVIIQDGLRRMVTDQEDVFYYITVMNENYAHPAIPEGSEQDILKGMYLLKKSKTEEKRPCVQLLGSGTILQEVIAAEKLLKEDWGVSANIWSCTSFNELARDGHHCERLNLLNPSSKPQKPHITKLLNHQAGPVIAATDYVRLFADQVRPFIKQPYYVLGTDGFGRSGTREQLRDFFEVNRYWITAMALRALADNQKALPSLWEKALKKYNISESKPNPMVS